MGAQMSFIRGDQGSGRMLAGVLTKDSQISFHRTPPCRKTKESHTCQEFATCRQQLPPLNLILTFAPFPSFNSFRWRALHKASSGNNKRLCVLCLERTGVGFMCTEFQPFAFLSCVVDLKPHPILGRDHYKIILAARKQSFREHIDLDKVTWLERHKGRLHTRIWLSQHLPMSLLPAAIQGTRCSNWLCLVAFFIAVTKYPTKTRSPWLTVGGDATGHGGKVQGQGYGTIWPYCVAVRKRQMALALVPSWVRTFLS